MARGTMFSAPLQVLLPDRSVVEIVDIDGALTGAVAPTSISADTTFTTNVKALFRDSGIYINSPADGKIQIVADGSGTDDILLSGKVTIDDDVTMSGALSVGSTLSAAGAVTLSSTTAVGDDMTFATNKKAIFRSSGIYINSGAAGKITIAADGGGADDITLSGGVTLSSTLAVTGAVTLSSTLASGALSVTGAITATTTIVATTGIQAAAVARTATADGTGTGTIAANNSVIAVTCDDANKIIVLPTPTPGVRVVLLPAATGYELRTSSPTTISINGGSGAAAESAIPSGKTVFMTCASATAWVGFYQAADGTLTAVEAAAP